MPTTIFTFLSDQFQQDIKQRAEIGATRFETVMENYKNIFWTEFSSLNHLSTCDELNMKIQHLSAIDKHNLQVWLDCFQQTIKASSGSLETFFNDLIEIYKTYVKGELTSASTMFNQLLANNNLYNTSADFEEYYPITFRGRINSKYSGFNPWKRLLTFVQNFKNRPKQSADYFYHIPFDKLNFIKNYRFSITGQPFIYLGASLPTVLLELRSDLSDFKNIELSAWGIKPNESLKMYDISNSLYDLINLIIIPIFQSGSDINSQDINIKPNITTFVTDFKKFIISQFCTFKKKDFDGQIFIEQYVLPQLLTEQIRNYKPIKYDGFIFPSTQYLDRVSSVNNEIYYGLFKNNIALFTNYSSTDNYDKNLISKFDIMTIDKSKSLASENYLEECDKIMHTDISRKLIKVKVKLLKKYYEKMQIDKVVLTELNSIKLQFATMLEYIKNL